MSGSALRRLTQSPVLWLGWALAIPCLVSTLTVGSGLPGVLTTGMCPPAATDIPAYPCSPWDYLARMTVGFWALAGHITVFCGWAGATAIAWMILRGILGRTTLSASEGGGPGVPMTRTGGSNE
jgi:hypothetical protein